MTIHSLDSGERRLGGLDLPQHFRGSIVFGLDYALSKIGYHGGWEATVDRFEYHAVDTTPEVVALTAAQAVLHAVGCHEQPVLDAERGMIAFPK